jgi:hypothetical protein
MADRRLAQRRAGGRARSTRGARQRKRIVGSGCSTSQLRSAAHHALRSELLALVGEDLDWGYLEAMAVLERREQTGGTTPDDVSDPCGTPDSYDHR